MAYRAIPRHPFKKPGVAAFLNRCAVQGRPMAIYTSCERKLCCAALEHHNIRSLFQSIFSPGNWGGKGFSRGFLHRSPAAGHSAGALSL